MLASAKKTRPKSLFRCQACGHAESKWLGRCPNCPEWNSLVEEAESRRVGCGKNLEARAVALAEIDDLPDVKRFPTNLAELDRVLGGGLVAGSVVLLGGEPGVGKSTLLCQMLAGLCRKGLHTALYVSGEESL